MTSLDFPDINRPSGRLGHGSPHELPSPDETTGEWFTDGVSFAIGSDRPAAHDPTRLVEALAEIEARRAAIEWLLEADFLRVCLV